MWIDENNSHLQDQTFKSVSCPACNSLHFINVSTGKLLGSVAETDGSKRLCRKPL